jgi:formate hydrogenlyase transcriptional activator
MDTNELRAFIDGIPAFAWSARPDGFPEFVNHGLQDYTGLSTEQLYCDWKPILHQDEVEQFEKWWLNLQASRRPGQTELRLRRADGEYRWFHISAASVHDEHGNLVRWYGVNIDIDDRKRAEQKLQQNEESLRTIIDAIRQAVVVLAPDGTTLYANRVALEITGLTLGEVADNSFLTRAFHPDDVDRLREERQERLLRGIPFELEMRVRPQNGAYRWYLNQYNPLKDERGQITRWYVTGTDIEERKQAEERLRNETLVLREEIDRTSMFEEIVGSSKPIRHVVKQVEKVAPSDSTVLILGETGTGKELIARALHRRSKRANRVFVRVNCAAIPQSLIASELFGHEKGAFTGALQRRLGRFEAADGGTLFLDEIGELPIETQIALLRVLQEREFERVGSNHPVKVDVRLIAATNRDLPSAVAAGTFREDLFYRLNVFPIGVPPLRERAEDIPLLVEYFVSRFAQSSGKNIRQIGKDTLEKLKTYDWPGNIRELQNVVERAVIVSEAETFVVDESWLSVNPRKTVSAASPPAGHESGTSRREYDGLAELAEREVEMIEAALAETHGRISGPSGAAAKLGIPRQTLESKIKRLGIDKYGQKRQPSK